MVWGSMCYHGVGSLVRLEGRVNANDYQEVLEQYMLNDADSLIGDDFVLKHDNAPIHTARSTRQWLRDNSVITVLDWPPNSPDANPIENLWRDVKIAANRHHPRTQEELWEAVSEAWQTIPCTGTCAESGSERCAKSYRYS